MTPKSQTRSEKNDCWAVTELTTFIQKVESEAHAAGEKSGIEKCLKEVEYGEYFPDDHYVSKVRLIEELKSLLPLDTNN